MTKRQLHVVDEALQQMPKSVWDWKKTAALLPSARRFILTDQASIKLGEVTKETEGLMLKHHQFAVAPFPVTYLEFNIHLFHKALGRPTTNDLYGDDGADWRVGYLITEKAIRSFAMTKDGFAGSTGFVLKRVAKDHKHWHIPINGVDQEWARLMCLLGSGLHSMPDEETRQAILDTWAMEPVFDDKSYDDKVYKSGAGELRTVIAILLMLNQPRVLNIQSVAHSSGLHKGKRIVYAAHNVVEIDLGTRKQYKRIFTHMERESPRRHEVRGHFVHNGGTDGCEHRWPLSPVPAPISGAPMWECPRCGCKRTWREAHLRGDASKGFVTKEYDLV